MTLVKICGLITEEAVAACAEAGAAFAGFVFYPPSPRYVTPQRAADLAAGLPESVQNVALFVDPDDEALEEVLRTFRPGMLQLHGTETPERVTAIKEKTALPVMKVIRVKTAEDVKAAQAYEDVADWLLFDAKTDHALPGGTGQSFDWSLLAGFETSLPWMLSGGLDAGNVGDALSVLGPDAVDISSGVEDVPGVKNAQKIKAFCQAVKTKKPSSP